MDLLLITCCKVDLDSESSRRYQIRIITKISNQNDYENIIKSELSQKHQLRMTTNMSNQNYNEVIKSEYHEYIIKLE